MIERGYVGKTGSFCTTFVCSYSGVMQGSIWLANLHMIVLISLIVLLRRLLFFTLCIPIYISLIFTLVHVHVCTFCIYYINYACIHVHCTCTLSIHICILHIAYSRLIFDIQVCYEYYTDYLHAYIIHVCKHLDELSIHVHVRKSWHQGSACKDYL